MLLVTGGTRMHFLVVHPRAKQANQHLKLLISQLKSLGQGAKVVENLSITFDTHTVSDMYVRESKDYHFLYHTTTRDTPLI